MKRGLLAVGFVAAVFAGTATGFLHAADGANADIAREQAAALTTANYTVIPHVQFSTGASSGTASFIRFTNTSGGAATFEVKVIGGETGTDYSPFKPFRITVADKASPQRSVDDIRRAIIADGGPDITPKSGDTFLNLYVTSDKTSGVGFQHVTYDGVTGFFENASACTYVASEDYTATNRQLINVHTSQLAGYPSKIEVHNPDFATRAIRATVYDAITGTSLGALTLNPAANASIVMDAAAIERQINFKPSATQLHVNIAFETADSMPYSAVALHKVTQAASGAAFNLTTLCKINTVRATACSAAPDTSTNPSGAGGATGDTCLSAVPDTLSQVFTVGKAGTIALSTLTANDTGATGAVLDAVTDFVGSDGVQNGAFTNTSTAITYTPARDGTTTFAYRLRGPTGQTSTAAVTLRVGGGAPEAVGDTLTQEFKPGVAGVIDIQSLIANDRNAEGATLEGVSGFKEYFGGISDVSPANGTYSAGPDKITYTPARTGTVGFFYRIRTAAGLSNQTLVVLNVSTGSGPPTAVADTLTQEISAGFPSQISFQSLLANDLNTTGAKVQDVTGFTDASGTNGTATISAEWIEYTPARAGTVTFSYRFKTAAGLSNAATATLTVKELNPLPVARPDTLTQTFTAGVASVIDIQSLVGNDINTTDARLVAATAFTDESGAVNGTATVLSDKITYTPARAGTVTFTYTFRNNVGASAAKVTLTVAAAAATRAPVAAQDELLNIAKTAAGDYLIPVASVIGNDIWAEGATLDSVTAVTDAGGRQIGTATIRDGAAIALTMLSSSPNPWVGMFTYKIKNAAGLSNPGIVTAYFTGPGTSVPVASADTLVGPFPPGSHRNVLYTEMLANDSSTGATTFAITSAGFRTKTTNAPNGTFTYMGNGRFDYVPSAAGDVIFYYTLTNSVGTSQPAAVTLTVK